MSGTVYLVGAGPGDPELLTLKAHHLLRHCDALVYDSLVPSALLDLVPPHCERHFVGKRRGHHSVPQPSTNAVLVELAERHTTIDGEAKASARARSASSARGATSWRWPRTVPC